MSGMRDLAMGKEPEPEPKYPTYKPYKPHDTSFGSRGYDHGYNSGSLFEDPITVSDYRKSKLPKDTKNTYKIVFTIDAKELGGVADDTNDLYDYKLASTAATEIAYDRIEELLGKNYESKYTIAFEVDDYVDEFEVTATLKKNK